MSPKYPRTYHIKNSPGGTSDDKRLPDVASFLNQELVFTEKMDGSNVCLERNACYSRSHSGPPTHESFDGLKKLHAEVKHLIPEGFQIYGEWLYALHSIAYSELPHYFMMFGIRDLSSMRWAGWDDVVMWAEELGTAHVPVLDQCSLDTEAKVLQHVEFLASSPSSCGGQREGVVVRLHQGFSDEDFSKSVCKWVRKNHVQTSEHWKDQVIVRNKLK